MQTMNSDLTTMQIESSSAKIFTVVYPKQNADTVILLHGGPGVPMDFSPIIKILSGKYQVITFDQRGTGRSPAPGSTYSIDEYLGDIDAIARHFGLNDFHLFGHSWGGLYAQIYAEKNPQRVLSMFLVSPSSGTGDLWKQTESEIMSFNKAQSGLWGWSSLGLKSFMGILGSDKAYRSLFKQVLENYHKQLDPAFVATDKMVENVRAAPINKTRLHLRKFPPLKDGVDYHFPIMIIYGQFDIYGESKEHVKQRYPKASFAEIVNAGHISWKQNSAKFYQTLNQFYGLR